MKKFTIIICLSIGLSSFCQERIAYSDTSKYYQFSVNYWFNMHHFLWLESFMNQELDSTLISLEIDENSKNELSKALAYYKTYLTKEDLRLSEYQTAFKNWITQDENTLDIIPTEFVEHFKILTEFSPTYQALFWKSHLEACTKVLDENISIIRNTEEKYVDRITKLTRQFWDFEPIKVDVTFYAKSSTWNPRNRPYTSIFPTHVVMNASGENEVPGNWVELLYHESAHHLILGSSYFIGGTIKDVTEVKGLKPTRQLWHVILFYLTGEVSKNLLQDHGITYPETYMQRNNVFGRYHQLIEKHFRPYLTRESTLAESVENFITEAAK
ncbi:hypothetical protein [Ekhidna sp.]|uniref:hypothetical protein n=1 Tax=Ekhidna sp. TaxID=2608089 RepID=UPI003CCBDD28